MRKADWELLLDKAPGDAELRQAYAVWLQDEADERQLAEFQRWLGREEKWPTNEPINADEVGWCWYWSDTPVSEPCKHATLEPWSLTHMPNIRWLYSSRREAEEALFLAWLAWQVELLEAREVPAIWSS